MSKKLVLILLVIALLVLLVVGCTKPLNVYSTAPISYSVVDTEMVKVDGIVSDHKATVWVNGVVVEVRKARTGGNGNFSAEVDLVEGPNTINIVAARDKEGEWKDIVSKTITVTYTPKA